MGARASDSEQTTPVGRRYVLMHQIGRGGMGEVWQAHDRLHGHEVALKRIRPNRLNGHQDEAEILRLGREFRILAGLHHPNVIGVLDYGFDRQQWPFFTMRLLDGCQSLTQAARHLDRPQRLDLLLQLFDGLAYLHHRGVLHRDLKPGNLLIKGERLHIVDFGLSIAVEEIDSVQGVAGTLNYLAPEFFAGHPPSEASDLYAAGLLLHEVLTGRQTRQSVERHPSSEQPLRFHHIDADDPELGDDLGRLVTRLLARHPQDRLQDHAAIIAALARARGLGPRPSARLEAVDDDGVVARSSPLVGRERELTELNGLLDRTVDGIGGSLSIHGMVGSGKSRLIEELRSLAMVRGALVVNGRCPAEGGLPFAPWRPLLRLLVLELDVPERLAAILRPLVPDIEALTGRTLPAGHDADPGGLVARVAGAIVELLRQRRRAVVMVLEDMHWGGAESLELFAVLSASTAELPLLLVASARHDEAEDLGRRLGDPQEMRLTPLGSDAICSLAEAALGPVGRSPALLELLTRESEGNPLLAVEVLRAVVERAGGWDRVDAAALPDSLLVGGMRGLVARRLRRLDPTLTGLLETAALAGREIDTDVLCAIDENARWSDMLGGAVRLGLLEFRADQCQFVHEQLRQAVIEGIEPQRRRTLHERIASVLESQASTLRPGELAYHWRQADEPHREAVWAMADGRESLGSGAYRHALDQFERVLELQRRHPRGFPADIPLHELRFLAGEAAFRAGVLDRSAEHLRRLLADCGEPVSTTPWRRSLRLVMEAAVQTQHRLVCQSLWPACRKTRDRRHLTARAWELLARISIYGGDGVGILTCSLRATNQSESVHRPLVYAGSLVGSTAASVGLWNLAQSYFGRGRAIAEMTDDHVSISDSLVMESACLLGAGRIPEAIDHLREARRHAELADYTLGRGQAIIVEGVCHGYAGDLLTMLNCEREALEVIRHHSRGHQAGFRAGCALALIHLGRFAEARMELERAQGMAAEDDRLGRSLIAAEFTLIHLRDGDIPAAVAADEVRAGLLNGFTAIPQPCAQVFEAPCELLVARLWAAHRGGGISNDLQQQAEALDRTFARWAKLFAIGRPMLGWYRGHCAMLGGDHERAWRTWEEARLLAASLRLPLLEVTLLTALVEHGPAAQRQAHRARARALATQCRAGWHLRRLGEETKVITLRTPRTAVDLAPPMPVTVRMDRNGSGTPPRQGRIESEADTQPLGISVTETRTST